MLKVKENKIFASVLADGAIHIECDEGDVGAVKREYETSDGKKGVKFEKVYTEISGIINKVSFYDGDFGKSLQLEITDEGEDPITLSLSTSSNFGEDMMKKLPNINLEERVVLAPYAFVNDNGKSVKGITVTQNDKKIQNYFYDFSKKEYLNGHPIPKQAKITKANPEGKLSKEQWKAFYLEARIFLIEYIEEMFPSTQDEKVVDELDSYGEDIQPENIEI